MSESETQTADEPFKAGSKEIGAIAHLYRAEAYRSTIWRQRLDMTTNWAVVTTGIALSLTFSSKEASALPLVLVGLLVAMFLHLEARRYRYFDVWRFRARILEIGFYVPILRGQEATIPQDKGHPLSEDYMRPRFRVGYWRAVGKRLRRNYAFIFVIQVMAYLGKIEIHPTDLQTYQQFIDRAAIGPIDGHIALACGAVFHGGWIFIAIYTLIQERADKSETKDVLDWDEHQEEPPP
ncbi:DUF2270 domain-containing protein [Ponticaulis sp.]|uniref:DUF2270 domain-containing protein n=1 Tax=Ponticaulis sp. TaxID=2020902 RepID=UPI000B6C3A8E|nr:DUF2270 domain-containing protein [Ponticaulis sp.]MAI90778.1 hypothetical protein [Ponticaulis sp.]OUX99003.1 MAG: hypothetical protein CBB65_10080 [Hyphomonadaceae bacterium TMED5]|tara:strand:+ start:61195 stop:61905 length:711 start_codon:yes stop_codon:yes gene_type:complete